MTEPKEKELKPCPYCGKLPTDTIGQDCDGIYKACACDCVGFKRIPQSTWNNAYCWKELDSKDKQIEELINGIYATKTIKELELKFQAARNVAKHEAEGADQYRSWNVDQEIENEVKRLEK